MKGWKARKPSYFFVVFGEVYASGHPVDGGVYPHRKGYRYISNLGVSAGDVLLLYCGRGYPDYDKEAPGIGVVIGTETDDEVEEIDYQYFPLDDEVPLDAVKNTIPGLHFPLHYSGNLLQKISKASFQGALAGRQIIWP